MKADIALFDIGPCVFPDYRLCLIFNLGGFVNVRAMLVPCLSA